MPLDTEPKQELDVIIITVGVIVLNQDYHLIVLQYYHEDILRSIHHQQDPRINIREEKEIKTNLPTATHKIQ